MDNPIVYIKGDLIQTAGMITETSAGLPGIELNGSSIQHIQAENITNNVDFSINNDVGVVLLANLSLPYRLSVNERDRAYQFIPANVAYRLQPPGRFYCQQ